MKLRHLIIAGTALVALGTVMATPALASTGGNVKAGTIAPDNRFCNCGN